MLRESLPIYQLYVLLHRANCQTSGVKQYSRTNYRTALRGQLYAACCARYKGTDKAKCTADGGHRALTI